MALKNMCFPASLNKMGDIIKKNNLCIPGVPEGEEKEKGEISLKK